MFKHIASVFLSISCLLGVARAQQAPETPLTSYMTLIDRVYSAGAGTYLWSPEPFAMVVTNSGKGTSRPRFENDYPKTTTCIRHDLLGNWFYKDSEAFGLMPAATAEDLALINEEPVIEPSSISYRFDQVNTEVEMTGTVRANIYRMTYPAGEGNHLRLLNFQHLVLNGPNEAHALATVTDGPSQQFYLVIRSDTPMTGSSLDPTREITDENSGRKAPMTGLGRIDFDLPEGGTVELRVGFSWSGFEQAAKNLEVEIGDRSFDDVRQSSLQSWEDLAQKIRIDAPENLKHSFYSYLYISCVFNPRICSDVDGSYQKIIGHKGEPIGQLPEGEVHYNNWWDGMGDLKSKYPLYALIIPDVLADIMDSHVRDYLDSEDRLTSKVKGRFPHDTMWATYPDLLLAEAYLRGVRDFDAEGALQGMLHNGRNLRSRGLYRDGDDIERYHAMGYFPVDKPDGNLQPQAGSQTLNGANCDWAIAMMARAMGREDVFAEFAPRALNYRHLWYPELGLVRPRMTDGSWYQGTPDKPWDMFDFHGGGFAEENAYSATTTYIFQDQEWIEEQMTPERYEQRLDDWFGETGEFAEDGRAGRFGGAKGSSAPFCYHYIGKPWKAQRVLRQKLLVEGERDSPLIGADAVSYSDSGTASAISVLHMLGLNTYIYGHPSYFIGTPLVNRAEIDVSGGTLTVIAENNDLQIDTVIQSATLNGEPYDKSYLMHDAVAQGGELIFQMGPAPSDWASAPEARPYSVSNERWEPDWPDEPAGDAPPKP